MGTPGGDGRGYFFQDPLQRPSLDCDADDRPRAIRTRGSRVALDRLEGTGSVEEDSLARPAHVPGRNDSGRRYVTRSTRSPSRLASAIRSLKARTVAGPSATG